MDEDFKKNNTSDAFKCVKRFKAGFKASTIFCRDSEGNLLTKPEEVKSRWVEYFQRTPKYNRRRGWRDGMAGRAPDPLRE
jgi:hypothetical protein